jgi:hypothetical protein
MVDSKTADIETASRTSTLDIVLRAGTGSMASPAVDPMADITPAIPDSFWERAQRILKLLILLNLLITKKPCSSSNRSGAGALFAQG